VIVAVPPVLARRIRFEPALPPAHAKLLARVPMGRVIKLQAVYDEPFWRADGLAGYANTDVPAVELTFDNSPPDAAAGVLLGFMEGAQAAAWAKRSARSAARAFREWRRRLRRRRALAAGGARARLGAGALVARRLRRPPPPGTLTRYKGALRRPAHGSHFAGTETATYWNGYMDGAVRSGNGPRARCAPRCEPRRAAPARGRRARRPGARDGAGRATVRGAAGRPHRADHRLGRPEAGRAARLRDAGKARPGARPHAADVRREGRVPAPRARVLVPRAARRHHLYVIAANDQAPFRRTRRRAAVRALGPPHARFAYEATSRDIFNEVFLWGPEDVRRSGPGVLRNVLASNRKVPLTPIEQAIGLAAGPALGAAARRNLRPFRIPGTQARLGFATSLPASATATPAAIRART
jgi:hypothetical protein